MRRREFIAGLGSAATWPVVARAQQSDRMRHIGVLTNLPADDAQMQTRNGAFLQALQRLGWTPGGNVEIEYRWGGEVADRNREYAAELVALAPDVIVSAGGSSGLAALQRATRTGTRRNQSRNGVVERGCNFMQRPRVARPKVGSSRLRFAASATFGGSRRQTIQHALGIA